MTLYVESNFVLELALEQEEHLHCDALIDVCRLNDVGLAIPAFSVAEPYTTLWRRHAARRDLHRALESEFRQLVRSGPYTGAAGSMQALTSFLVGSIEEESRRFAGAARGVLSMAHAIPLTAAVLSDAFAYTTRFDFELPDAIVLASILADLETRAPSWSCAVSRDKGFDIGEVHALLEEKDCKLLFTFESGLNYVRSQAAAHGSPPQASA